LTETSPSVSCNTETRNRIGTVGPVIDGVDVLIAEDGEILVKGNTVMKGYYNRPDDNEDAFTLDGWLRTGDIGHLDSDGFLVITDRKKDLIKTSGGKYVAPQMIEGMINQSEFVEQAVIVGDKRKYVSALIVPDFERLRAWAKEQGVGTTDKRELIADRRVVDMIKADVNRLTRELADYEKVKRIGLLAEEFSIDGGELTPTLKVKRRVVEEKYGELIESLYSGGE